MIGLVVLSPFLLVIALLVQVYLGGPVLFRQVRPGYHGKLFAIIKFRTMTDQRDTQGRLLPDKHRLTQLGHTLRALTLDELPELINVLRGEMSLVGPRPLLAKYLDRYTPEQARRHNVLPGITGWAQINGRNALTWEDKFVLDVWYVDHWSFWLDIKILLQTVGKVLSREGINPRVDWHARYLQQAGWTSITRGYLYEKTGFSPKPLASWRSDAGRAHCSPNSQLSPQRKSMDWT